MRIGRGAIFGRCRIGSSGASRAMNASRAAPSRFGVNRNQSLKDRVPAM